MSDRLTDRELREIVRIQHTPLYPKDGSPRALARECLRLRRRLRRARTVIADHCTMPDIDREHELDGIDRDLGAKERKR